ALEPIHRNSPVSLRYAAGLTGLELPQSFAVRKQALGVCIGGNFDQRAVDFDARPSAGAALLALAPRSLRCQLTQPRFTGKSLLLECHVQAFGNIRTKPGRYD